MWPGSKVTLPEASGNVIVRSPVGSVTVNVVSLALFVAPSKIITASSLRFNVPEVICPVVLILSPALTGLKTLGVLLLFQKPTFPVLLPAPVVAIVILPVLLPMLIPVPAVNVARVKELGELSAFPINN